MNNNILIVDDEKEIRNLLEINLKNEGYHVFKAKCGEEALKILEKEEVHLMVLDVMMPDMDGFEVCSKVRERYNIPILMLSAKGEDIDKIQGIMTGADDYVCKPFNNLELTVRIRALFRRTYFLNTKIQVSDDIIRIESMIIDKWKHKITIANNEVSLTAREFEILYLLATNRGRVFSAEEIFEKVWKEKYYQSKHTKIQFINYMWDYWYILKYRILGNYIYIIVGLPMVLLVHFVITYRRNRSLACIINETEMMVKGDLDKLIEINAKGDMKNLAQNINNISKQLKKRTLEERKAQKTKNDLITNVSHDLRTPLTSIIGYLEIIDSDKYKDEIQLRYYANIAYEKSKSLNLLINDLFELTKMQNNTIKLEKVKINLVELLGQVIAYFKCQFDNEKMKARIKFSEDKLIVNADAEKLVRAFENLLSNSIKYGRDGYYVDIITKSEGDMAIVQIINYGEAIPAIDLPYIFDRFYRIEKSRNSDIGGSGLGLAITKNIIELHQGRISAYSDENKTIFEVRLPI
ncbi:response regulator [Clostridium botulinum]|nr:response regulator [Clostridium botulinum]NFS98009.1 response regulator [Clostridium botulinum]